MSDTSVDPRKSFSLNAFKSALVGGGARPNLFEVTMGDIPALKTKFNDRFKFMCKAASLPASNIASIDVPFRGRIFKVAGDRTIENWTVTVINDESFEFRNIFEDWMNNIVRLENNTGATNPLSYMAQAEVTQLGRNVASGADQKDAGKATVQGYAASASGTDIKNLAKYSFQDIWPVNISAIDLSYENSDQIEEYTVEFAVQSYSSLRR